MADIIQMPVPMKLPTIYPIDFPEGDPPPGPDPVVKSLPAGAINGNLAIAAAVEEPYQLAGLVVGAIWKGNAGDLCGRLHVLIVPENASSFEIDHDIRNAQRLLRRIALNGPQGLHVMKQ